MQVRYYDAEPSNGNNNCAGRLKVGGNYYNAATHNPSGSTYTARSDNWATNPKTAASWTVDDVNGVGANALQAFGFYSGDANPAIRFSCVELQVTYTPALYAVAAGSGQLLGYRLVASFGKGSRVAAGEGSYAETGASVTLRRGFSVGAGPGVMSCSGRLPLLMQIGICRWERGVAP